MCTKGVYYAPLSPFFLIPILQYSVVCRERGVRSLYSHVSSRQCVCDAPDVPVDQDKRSAGGPAKGGVGEGQSPLDGATFLLLFLTSIITL